MTTRKFNFKHLTDDQLQEIAGTYPDAVESVTIVKPVYSKMAMLAQCGARLESGKRITDFLKEECGAEKDTVAQENDLLHDLADRKIPQRAKV